jgi:hypothetical protein
LVLSEPQQATAESAAPQIVGKEEEVDEQEAERGAAGESTDGLFGLRIADDHRLLLRGRRVGEVYDGLAAIALPEPPSS